MEQKEGKKLKRSYYLKPEKIIRDLVHGYINLTRFDLELIDTVLFQRLSDIRQLTCQHVYPAARHTRFEHSLGVEELMRNAIKYLNRNGIIGEPQRPDSERIISEELEFNACVAALLHDVGHCPFSHMGETEFDKDIVRRALVDTVKGHKCLKDCTDLIKKLDEGENIGAVHEQLSCIVILNEYSDKLMDLAEKVTNQDNSGACEIETDFELTIHSSPDKLMELIKKADGQDNLDACKIETDFELTVHSSPDKLIELIKKADGQDNPDACEIETDFELIIRSILGLEYDVSTTANFEAHKTKNIIVRLLNSKIIDVDKLDYIIRDSYLTGIGTPAIDTQRLFRNMYLDKNYSLVFTSRAVPALQNMIDARDGLYLYVYNHHAVVYSDFLNTYISRRLYHNAKAFYGAIYPDIMEKDLETSLRELPPVFSLGIVPKSYFFSVDGVGKKHYSDSAWLSLLNNIHISYTNLLEEAGERRDPEELSEEAQKTVKEHIQTEIQKKLHGEIERLDLKPISIETQDGETKIYKPQIELLEASTQDLAERIFVSMQLIHQSMRRQYLKPWWKTVFEFSNFMRYYFQSDPVREQIGKFICTGGDFGLKADEFRSQIAKHMIYITQRLKTEGKAKDFGLLEALNDGDFFVIQRSPRFFGPDAIERIEIALKSNEILGPPADVNRQVHEYYIKTLTNIIPQKDYKATYAQEGFYIFSKQVTNKKAKSENAKNRHYKLLERIFAFVAKEFVDQGEQKFVEVFQDRNMSKEQSDQAKKKSKEDMYDDFLRQ